MPEACYLKDMSLILANLLRVQSKFWGPTSRNELKLRKSASINPIWRFSTEVWWLWKVFEDFVAFSVVCRYIVSTVTTHHCAASAFPPHHNQCDLSRMPVLLLTNWHEAPRKFFLSTSSGPTFVQFIKPSWGVKSLMNGFFPRPIIWVTGFFIFYSHFYSLEQLWIISFFPKSRTT